MSAHTSLFEQALSPKLYLTNLNLRGNPLCNEPNYRLTALQRRAREGGGIWSRHA